MFEKTNDHIGKNNQHSFLTSYSSDKIRVVSFISIVLVLYIHCGFHETAGEIAGMTGNILLQDAISSKIARTAVPMFFMISGMLFFRNITCMNDVWHKMKKRARTLLVPYLIAALFLPAVYALMSFLPWTARFVNSSDGGSVFSLPLPDMLMSLYVAVPGSAESSGFHLWFLRDLIIIVVLSPVLYEIRKRIGGGILLIILFALSFMPIKLPVVTSAFWFIAGDVFLLHLSTRHKWVWLAVYVVLCIAEVLFHSVVWEWIGIPIIFVGVAALWNLYDMIAGPTFRLSDSMLLAYSCQLTFFIYLYHEPTLNIVRKLLLVPLVKSSLSFAAIYLVAPWIFLLLIIPTGLLMRRYLRGFYEILVGGR